ncbi:MAG: LysM peptidoglycan-binding domain-containing protein [Elusimicrobia bacterium]|nr:LysM peptidoglycan-binding domain-containing protein [Elusimicrobiota bacterium]
MTLFLLPLIALAANAESLSVESLIAQNPGLVQTKADAVSLRTLVDAVLADPNNPKSRLLLENLVQEKLAQHYDEVQSKKREALNQGLRVSREMKASADTQMRIIQALKTLPAEQRSSPSNLFLALLHEAVKHFDEGREAEGVSTLLAAMTLNPALSEATARLSKTPAAGPAPPVLQPPAVAPAAIEGSLEGGTKASNHVVVGRRAAAAFGVKAAATPPSLPQPPAAVRLVKPGEVNLGQYYFGVGLRAYSAGKLPEAAQAFRQSLDHDPGNEWVRKSLERTEGELKLQAATAPLTPSLNMPRTDVKASRALPAFPPEPKASSVEPETAAPEPRVGAPEPVPSAVSAEPAIVTRQSGRSYVVRKGDRLWSIAQRFYGDGFKWPLIEGANPQVKGSQLSAGDTLVIPALPAEAPPAAARRVQEEPAAPAPAPVPVPSVRAGRPVGMRTDLAWRHTVKQGETLWRISTRYYGTPGRWDLIVKANPQLQQGTTLEPGMVLVIPPLPQAEQPAAEARP